MGPIQLFCSTPAAPSNLKAGPSDQLWRAMAQGKVKKRDKRLALQRFPGVVKTPLRRHSGEKKLLLPEIPKVGEWGRVCPRCSQFTAWNRVFYSNSVIKADICFNWLVIDFHVRGHAN